MSIEWDMSQVDRLAADLGKGTARLVKTGREAVKAQMETLKPAAQAKATANNPRHARKYPRTITYDFKPSFTTITGEVGPEQGGQGSLGGILENGVRNRAQNNLQRALEENMELFMTRVEKAADDALGDV